MKTLAPHMGATRFTRWVVKELRAAAPAGRRPEAQRSRRIEVEFAFRVRDTRFAGTAAGERQLKLGHEVSNMRL
jgi:hypothetical protein